VTEARQTAGHSKYHTALHGKRNHINPDNAALGEVVIIWLLLAIFILSNIWNAGLHSLQRGCTETDIQLGEIEVLQV